MAENKEITAKSYMLLTNNGDWLGQVVLTSDGAFMAITDWGNFNFTWRAYKSLPEFKQFLLRINTEYFARKMMEGMQYVAFGRKIEQAAVRFAEKVLPSLQDILNKEI